MNPRIRAEADFKTRLAAKGPGATPPNDAAPGRSLDAVRAEALAAYDRIEAATKVLAGQAVRSALFEGGRGFDCESFRIARALLRAGDELPKPNGGRLHEFSDANKPSLELGLFSPQPIYTDFETLNLADSLTWLATEAGADDPLVRQALAGKSPRDRAAELVSSTKVRDVAFRKRLYQGGASAVAGASDPMIEFARLVDPESRRLRKVSEEQDEIKHQAHAAIARARNALLGAGGLQYPDATGTLRLSFGTVKGYEENGREISPFTTLGGLYRRAAGMGGRPPFDLTPRWSKSRGRLHPDTPFNFVSTCDIIGGNSGSPVVNRAGEFVGIIFDGNLQGLPWDYAFDDRQGRAIAVDSAAIIEGLDRVYGAKELVRELLDGKRR